MEIFAPWYKKSIMVYDKLIELGYEVVSVNLYGSQNYKTDTPNSDFDFTAVVLPSINDIIYNHEPISKEIEYQGGLINIKDIRLMWENYKKQNPNYIETLFTPYILVNPKYTEDWHNIREIAEEIAYANPVRAVKAMYGMALNKQYKIFHAVPSNSESIMKYGYDGKSYSEVIRLYLTALNYIAGKPYKDCLVLTELRRKSCIGIKTYAEIYPIETIEFVLECVMFAFKKAVDDFISKEQTFIDVYPKMDKIKENIMKKYFKEQL